MPGRPGRGGQVVAGEPGQGVAVEEKSARPAVLGHRRVGEGEVGRPGSIAVGTRWRGRRPGRPRSPGRPGHPRPKPPTARGGPVGADGAGMGGHPIRRPHSPPRRARGRGGSGPRRRPPGTLASARQVASALNRSPTTNPPPWNQTSTGRGARPRAGVNPQPQRPAGSSREIPVLVAHRLQLGWWRRPGCAGCAGPGPGSQARPADEVEPGEEGPCPRVDPAPRPAGGRSPGRRGWLGHRQARPGRPSMGRVAPGAGPCRWGCGQGVDQVTDSGIL